MTPEALTRGWIAAHRFGQGGSAAEIEALAASGPRKALAAQLKSPQILPAALRDQPDQAAVDRLLWPILEADPRSRDARLEAERRARELYTTEIHARLLAAIESATPFFERLVHFWGNHFTVSVQNRQVLGLAGAFEREAIRPFVLGRFRDMLRASTGHPAMLAYLNNDVSTGPDSAFGQRRNRGLNENLAREILELHTLGVDGGYEQADVTEFARILTGWSTERPGQRLPGGFVWRPRIHQPGPKRLLGKRIAEAGPEEAEAAFDLLAEHPATARHIGTKLARHFYGDQPPPAAVRFLSSRFKATGGDLGRVTAALLDFDGALDLPLGKVKTPHEFVVAAARATGWRPGGVEEAVSILTALNHRSFAALSPAGHPDRAEDWIGPDAVLRRLDAAARMARALPESMDPTAFAAGLIGPVARPETLQTLLATPPEQIPILALASAEFNRR